MRTLVLIGFLSGFYLSFYGGQKVGLSLLLQQAHADVPDVNHELERLRGFAEQEKEDREFNQERLLGVSEAKKNRQDWEKKQAASLPGYKLWKANEGHTPGENSPEYREDLKARTLSHQESAEDRLKYAAQELKFRQELARKRPLKECQ